MKDTSIKNMDSLRDFLLNQMEEVANSNIAPAIGNSVANLASQAIQVIGLSLKHTKKSEGNKSIKFIESAPEAEINNEVKQ